MTKEKALLVFGIIIIAIPNLGFPNIAEKIILTFFGVLVIIIAYGIHFEKNKSIKKQEFVRPIKEKDVVSFRQTKEFNQVQSKEESINEDVIVEKNIFPKEEITGFKYVNRQTKKPEIKRSVQENESPS